MSFHILEQGGQALTNFQRAQIHEPDSPARELKPDGNLTNSTSNSWTATALKTLKQQSKAKQFQLIDNSKPAEILWFQIQPTEPL